MRLIDGLLVLVATVGPVVAETPRPPAARADKSSVRKTRPSAPAAQPKPSRKADPKLADQESGGNCDRERKLGINPTGGRLHIGLKTYAETLKLEAKEVVLTFDDGPWPETTPQILDALRDACVHATFFLIGKRTRKAPWLAKREHDEGHTVGHHSDTHPPFTLRGFDTASAIADIKRGIDAEERALYRDGASPPDSPHVPFFRFPGFADSPELLDHLDRNGFAVFGTDLWAGDWMRMSPEHERERVLRLLDEAPNHNGIILFHDNIRSTAAMLPGLLLELRRRGYRIVHLVYDPTAGPPALTPPIEGWTHDGSETERIIRHLRKPIIPGAHHSGDAAADPGLRPSDGIESGPQ